ncbi:branched-chain amino acid transport system II carrier protein [Chlamydiifrater volucris]|uniref:branched-chain amino acid transport system II carrier protein n=1 Tax=Chlamydiifrater volucris TaxID=2681470 RepID=UPI001BD0B63B|nr:branched-chain amino acid transport system II carrier protein [Chlamydiifrater volucris]
MKFSSKNNKKKKQTAPISFLSIAGTVFAMFFGAGNTVFPIVVGAINYPHYLCASFGMIVSAVIVPLLGLISILLYSGDYKKFFLSIGKIPGMFIIVAILCLIGPFGGIPRAIAISYSTLASFSVKTSFLPSLPWFSLLCCILIFLFSNKLSNLVAWLGYIFSPIMLLSLGWTVVRGLMQESHIPDLALLHPSRPQAFLSGVIEGFNTMDLLASFFFSSILIVSLRELSRQNNHPGHASDESPLAFQNIGEKSKKTIFFGFLLASFFLAVVYVGFSALSSRHSGALLHFPKGDCLGRICHLTLGSKAFIPTLGIFIACLTTEIALTGIFADFMRRSCLPKNTPFSVAVVITLVPTYLVSILNFDNISGLLLPVLQFCYPALIGLTIGNICHKLWNLRHAGTVFFYVILALELVMKCL